MIRRHIAYVSWDDAPHREDFARPDGYLAVLAADHDVAREAVTELVGETGWEFWGRVAPDAATHPAGMLAILAVGESDSQLWVDVDGFLEPRPFGAPDPWTPAVAEGVA